MKAKFDTFTIEPDKDHFVVYGHGYYDRSSVLAGQRRRSFQSRFDSVADAQAAFPSADVLTHSTRPMRFGGESLGDLSGLPLCAPSWFDPADAGESWDGDY